MKKNSTLKILVASLLALYLIGCGSASLKEDRNSIKNYNSDNQKHSNRDTNPTNKDCTTTYDDQKEVYIINPSMECKPNYSLTWRNNSKTLKVEFRDDSLYSAFSKKSPAYILDIDADGLQDGVHIFGYDEKTRYNWDVHTEYQDKPKISWDAKFSNDFIIYVVVVFLDKNGTVIQGKDLFYTPNKTGYDKYIDEHMQIVLSGSDDGKWHHYERDILEDIQKFFPDATFNRESEDYKTRGYINGFAVAGKGQITNIKLSK